MGAMDSIKSAIGKALHPARSGASGLAMHKLGLAPRLPLSSAAAAVMGRSARRDRVARSLM